MAGLDGYLLFAVGGEVSQLSDLQKLYHWESRVHSQKNAPKSGTKEGRGPRNSRTEVTVVATAVASLRN